VQAEVITFKCWCHLHTAVAGNAVKVVFIALIATPHGAIQPEAGLDRARTHKVIALASKGLLCHCVLHDIPPIQSHKSLTAQLLRSGRNIPMGFGPFDAIHLLCNSRRAG
jgi:hypothetical protein